MRLTVKLTPAAVTMTGNLDVGTASGRFFLSNNNQVEWISFTGKTANWDGTYTYTGLSRGLSQTADPITAWTGSTWLPNQECILVAMHDQLVDKTQATTFVENITFAKDINFTGTTTGGLTLKSLTTAQRDALTPVVWYKFFNTTTGTVQTYYSGTWNTEWNSATPNADTTTAGKVEIATQAEVNAGTDTGGTGATVVVIPSTFRAWVMWAIDINSLTEKTTTTSNDLLLLSDSASSFANKKIKITNVKEYIAPTIFGDWSDGDVIISTTVTLVRDMYYANLTISAGGVLNPNWYKIYVNGTLTNSGAIRRNGNNGSNWTAGLNGWAAWATLNQWTLNAEIASWNGWQSWTSGWYAWVAWSNSSLSYTWITWATWWNSTTWHIGWSWWINTQWALYNTVYPIVTQLLYPASIWAAYPSTKYASSPWSGGWAWANVSWFLASGGWAGWQWWAIFIASKTFNNAGTIESIWGNGWNWGDGWNGTNYGWGWAGGQWGTVIIIYKTLTALWTITNTWGTKWLKWGWAATDWSNGTTGTIITIAV